MTLKERDIETGLDYFINRYYSSTQGRFTSGDVLVSGSNPIGYADFRNPQTLNGYAYVNNNPLITTDPDGHCPDGKPCPGTSIQPTNPIPEVRAQEAAAAGVADVAISAGKVVANIGIGINNFSNAFLNHNDPYGAIAPYESSSQRCRDARLRSFNGCSSIAWWIWASDHCNC